MTEATGQDVFDAALAYRELFPARDTHPRIGLLFRGEETIEFLVAMFAAISRGLTVVPLYPNWDAETQLSYLRLYGVGVVAVGDGFLRRLPRLAQVHVQINQPRANDFATAINLLRIGRRLEVCAHRLDFAI